MTIPNIWENPKNGNQTTNQLWMDVSPWSIAHCLIRGGSPAQDPEKMGPVEKEHTNGQQWNQTHVQVEKLTGCGHGVESILLGPIAIYPSPRQITWDKAKTPPEGLMVATMIPGISLPDADMSVAGIIVLWQVLKIFTWLNDGAPIDSQVCPIASTQQAISLQLIIWDIATFCT